MQTEKFTADFEIKISLKETDDKCFQFLTDDCSKDRGQTWN